jgi:hypothetical protein
MSLTRHLRIDEPGNRQIAETRDLAVARVRTRQTSDHTCGYASERAARARVSLHSAWILPTRTWSAWRTIPSDPAEAAAGNVTVPCATCGRCD